MDLHTIGRLSKIVEELTEHSGENHLYVLQELENSGIITSGESKAIEYALRSELKNHVNRFLDNSKLGTQP